MSFWLLLTPEWAALFSFDGGGGLHEMFKIVIIPIPDINECQVGSDLCNQVCTNIVGSYLCSCNSGYELTDENVNCTGKTQFSDI